MRVQQTIDCPTCHGLGYLRADVPPGHPDFGKLVPCACKQQELEARQFAHLVHISGLLPEELALRLDHVAPNGPGTANMLEIARQFVEDPFGFLTIYGDYGNGKTCILQAIINEFRLRYNIIGTYIRFYDLLEYIRAGFAQDATDDARARYHRLRDLPILAIDEIDAPRSTAYAEEFRRAFFDDRYRLAVARSAHTVFGLNCDPASLPGDLYDRLRDGRFHILHNPDPSMRPAMEW